MSFLEEYLTIVGYMTTASLAMYIFMWIYNPAQMSEHKNYIPNADPPPKRDIVEKIRELYKLGMSEFHEK